MRVMLILPALITTVKKIWKSIFVPCPRGNSSPDTFRLYEALEAGSIPIVERDEYWDLGAHQLFKFQIGIKLQAI